MSDDIIEIVDNQLQGPRGESGVGVPIGGAINEALVKQSSTNYDADWTVIDKTFVGLGNVDNTSDASKPISTLTQAALDLKATLVDGHVIESQLPAFSYLALGETITTAYRGDRGKTAYDHSQLISGNPHQVTLMDLGIENINNTSDASKPISTAMQSALNLKADLINGVVPVTQINQLFIVEAYADSSAFPVTGTDRVYYKANDTGLLFIWNYDSYSIISGVTGLGETNITAYRGDRGKLAYEHIFMLSGNPHQVTKAELGLDEVDNTSDASKPVSSATQTQLNLKAPIDSPTFTGTVTLSGSIRISGVTEPMAISTDATGLLVLTPTGGGGV